MKFVNHPTVRTAATLAGLTFTSTARGDDPPRRDPAPATSVPSLPALPPAERDTSLSDLLYKLEKQGKKKEKLITEMEGLLVKAAEVNELVKSKVANQTQAIPDQDGVPSPTTIAGDEKSVVASPSAQKSKASLKDWIFLGAPLFVGYVTLASTGYRYLRRVSRAYAANRLTPEHVKTFKLFTGNQGARIDAQTARSTGELLYHLQEALKVFEILAATAGHSQPSSWSLSGRSQLSKKARRTIVKPPDEAQKTAYWGIRVLLGDAIQAMKTQGIVPVRPEGAGVDPSLKDPASTGSSLRTKKMLRRHSRNGNRSAREGVSATSSPFEQGPSKTAEAGESARDEELLAAHRANIEQDRRKIQEEQALLARRKVELDGRESEAHNTLDLATAEKNAALSALTQAEATKRANEELRQQLIAMLKSIAEVGAAALASDPETALKILAAIAQGPHGSQSQEAPQNSL